MKRGFTLIELLVVMAIIALLLAIVSPRYFAHVGQAKEASLRQTLNVVRDAVDKFHGDTGVYPDSLDELVARRYLRSLPADPLTGRSDTWQLLAPPSAGDRGAVYDLRSGAPGTGANGVAYGDW
jgi:general secretion pathway protein G